MPSPTPHRPCPHTGRAPTKHVPSQSGTGVGTGTDRVVPVTSAFVAMSITVDRNELSQALAVLKKQKAVWFTGTGPVGLVAVESDSRCQINLASAVVDGQPPRHAPINPSELLTALEVFESATVRLGWVDTDWLQIDSGQEATVLRVPPGPPDPRHSRILAQDPEPDLPRLTINAQALAVMLEHALVSVRSAEHLRYRLNTVRLEANPDELTVVGTDGKRMAVSTSPCRYKGPPRRLLMTPQDARWLVWLCRTGKSAVLHMENVEATVDAPHGRLQFKYVDGKWPDWRLAMPGPAALPIRFKVSRAGLDKVLDAICKVRSPADHVNQGTFFEFRNGHRTVRLAGGYKGGQFYRFELPLIETAGPGFQSPGNPVFVLAFDASFVRDMLKAGKDEVLEFHTGNNADDAPIRLTGVTGLVQWTMLLMPTEIDEADRNWALADETHIKEPT